MSPNQLPIGWFDVLVLILMLSGFVHGRRNGMSVELLDLIKWLTVIVLGNLYYQPLGHWFAAHAGITHNYADLFVYITIIVVTWLAFAVIKKFVHGKLVSRQKFGRMETRLGMIAGTVRYLCYVFIGLVILNTPVYRPDESAAPISRLQQEVIYNSATGLFVRQYLQGSLIEPVDETPDTKITMAKQQEQEVNEVISRR